MNFNIDTLALIEIDKFSYGSSRSESSSEIQSKLAIIFSNSSSVITDSPDIAFTLYPVRFDCGFENSA